MSIDLKTLRVIIEGDDSGFKKTTRDAVKEVEKTASEINNLGKMKMPDLDSTGSMSQIQKTKEMLKATMGSPVVQLTKKAIGSTREYIRNVQVAAGIKTYSDDYLRLSDDIDNAEKSLERLKKEQDYLKGQNADRELTKPYQKLQISAQETEMALQKLLQKKIELEEKDEGYEYTFKYAETLKQFKEEQKRLADLTNERQEMFKRGVPTSGMKRINKNGVVSNINDEIVATGSQIELLREKMLDLEKSGKMLQPTEAMRKLEDRIGGAQEKLGKLKSQMTSMTAKGIDAGTPEWVRNQKNIEKTTREINDLRNACQQMENEGKDVQLNIDGSGATRKLKTIVATTREIISNIPVIGKVARASGSIVSGAFNGMHTVLKKIGPAIRTTSGAFASLIQRFSHGIPLLHRFNAGTRQSGNTFGNSLKTMLKYGLGIRSLFALVNRLRSALTDGLGNLAQYSSQTNASLSMLKSSLTQLKNSFATAFAPILNVAAPILNVLIQKVADTVTALGMLFASLTGQRAFIRAKKVNQDYAASLSGNASSADKANDANKRLQRTLLGFDEINKLDAADSSSAGTGGAGGGGLLPSDMFEEVPLSGSVSDFAEKLKEAWRKADFTEIGAIVGGKIRDGLEKIQWDKIKPNAEKVGKSVATLINGFVETAGLGESIGNTIAQGINTGVLGTNRFLENMHWESVGNFVANGINRFVENTSWSGVGMAVANGINGVFRLSKTWSGKFKFSSVGNAVSVAVNTALRNIEWSEANTSAAQVGAGIASALNSVMTPLTFRNIGRTIATAIGTVISGSHSFIRKIEWEDWGDAIAAGINEFFANINWGEAGLTFHDAAEDILKTMMRAISETDWEKVGKDIATFIKNIDFGDLLRNVGELIWEAIKASIKLWKSSFDAAPVETAIVTALAGMKFIGVAAKICSNIKKNIFGSSVSPSIELGNIKTNFTAKLGKVLGIAAVGTGITELIAASVDDEDAKKIVTSVGTGISSGAAIGSLVGPLGTLAGGIVGGLAGYIYEAPEWEMVRNSLSMSMSDLADNLKEGNWWDAFWGNVKTTDEGVSDEDNARNQSFWNQWNSRNSETKQSLNEVKEAAQNASVGIQGYEQSLVGLPSMVSTQVNAETETATKNVNIFKTLADKLGITKYRTEFEALTDKASVNVKKLTGESNLASGLKKLMFQANTSDAEEKTAGLEKKVDSVKTKSSIDLNVDTSSASAGLDLFTVLKLMVMKALLGNMKLDLNTADATKKLDSFLKQMEGMDKEKTVDFTGNDTDILGKIRSVSEAVKSMVSKKTVRFAGDTKELFNAADRVTEKVRQVVDEKVTSFRSDTADAENSILELNSRINAVSELKLIRFDADITPFLTLNDAMYQIGRDAAKSLRNGMMSVYIPTPHMYISRWNYHSNGNGGSIPTPQFSVQWYDSGGFPEMGEMFIARENGPEMVGRMGNRNVVANNGQITEGIKAAVIDGMMQVFMATKSEDGSGDNPPVIEITIKADDETLYRRTMKGKKKAERRYSVTANV